MDLSQRLAKLTPEQRAQLEARLRGRKDIPKVSLDAIKPRPPSEPCPLSFAQERLWFLERLEGVSATYNISFAYRLRGNLRPDCLERALAEIIRRHESLRTTFAAPAPDQPPEQRIAEAYEFRLERIDLSREADLQRERSVRQRIDEISRRPMSLAQGPLIQALLLRLEENDHVFALVVHHMVSDGWSFDIFFRELTTLYGDFVADRASSFPELAIQYGDYARWQRDHLKGERLASHLDYWKKRLNGIPPLLELPLDFPRPAEQTYRGSFCERRVDAALSQRILQLTRELDATLFMTILAAFQTLLHRYSGQTDILVGSPVTSRDRVELEPLIGFFVNMLPLRGNFSTPLSVRELIHQVRATTLEALSHQELPFEMLVREMRPERNLGHAPLFQVSFMFQQEDHTSLRLPAVVPESLPIDTGTAKFDLTLFASETKDGLKLWLEYSSVLFASQTAKRMLDHLVCLLESMVANPDAKVSQLNLLPAAEREQILFDWNRTEATYPREKTVHALFKEQASRAPNAVAVEFENQRLTYRELDRRADALALELEKRGVGLETAVGIYVERSIDMLVAVLGVLKAGASYVPLDPAFPSDRLAFMVADAQMPVLITQSRLAAELPAHQSQVVFVDTLAPLASDTNRERGEAHHLAYTLYTSGSTGKPKGVQIPHQAVVNFLYSMQKAPGARAEDKWLAITTLSFDIAGLELFLPLITGACVVIASRAETLDAGLLMKRMKSAKITAMQATPATFRMLLDAGWGGDSKLKVLCGGEAIDSELSERLLARCGELWNMYGPTETTIWSTTERLIAGEAITIGRPIANTQAYVLDENLQPTPPGVVGELFLGGDGLARGYLNRAELTREKFVPDPFDSRGHRRLYRTGDLSRFRADGKIVFLGRADHQVKIRGFRIEIGEIETALNTIKGVGQAVVVAREDTPGDKRLVAYVVPVQSLGPPAANVDEPSGATPPFGAAALRASLRAHLPEYMVPTAFVFLEALPLTPNGKVDRKALPRPDKSLTPEAEYEVPQGETEEKLAAILIALLRVPRVGRKDDFFSLGGHSLLAVTLFNEIEKTFGKKIPLATLFRAPTLQGLAAVLSTDREQPRTWSSLVPIQTKGKSPNLFCVHGAGGNILLYRDLVQSLGSDYSFYGLQSRGLDKSSEPLRTIEEMADAYLAEIRALQKEGPYCLGGYCLGGVIAYEMAQKLTKAGQDVALLAMFDSYNAFDVQEGNPFRYLWQKIVFHSKNLAGLSLKELPGYLSSKLRIASDGEFSSLMGSLTSSFRSEKASTSAKSVEKNVQKINDAAVAAYRPRPYGGRVTVFKPKVNYDFLPDPKMGWGEIVKGELEIVELPVNPHAMLIAPFVKRLASELKERLDVVNAADSSVSTGASKRGQFN